MRFVELPLAGAFLLELDRIEDGRGFFARAWCTETFAARGLASRIMQSNISWNRKRGTLRGLHFQAAPFQETKIVRCVRGSVYDVIADLREGSATFRRWTSVELTADNRIAVYVPKGLAHGFQTLTDDAEVFYEMFDPYVGEAARGVRWDDPVLGIQWPIDDPVVSERDRSFPRLA